jgi:predicted dehydrogenase
MNQILAVPFKVGIIGAGLIAPMHAAGFQEVPDLAQVSLVCDLDADRAAELAGPFNARTTSDWKQVISDPDIQLVDVLLPHHLHYLVAMSALEAGKHLLLEKPVAMTEKQSREIFDKASQVGVYFGVAENTCYIKAYEEAEKVIRSGRLGEINLVRTFLPANERMRLSSVDFWGKQAANGGGALIDSGAHTFYLMKWLFGGISDLQAFTSKKYQVGSEVEDNADVRGHLANGADFLCSFSFTTEVPHSERLEIYGTTGALIIDQLANPPAKFYAEPMDFDGTPLEGVKYDPLGWHFFSIVAEVSDFVRRLAAGQSPRVDPQDCIYAVRMIEKAYESVRKGNISITVSP